MAGPLLEGEESGERAVEELMSMVSWRAAGEGRSVAFANVQVLDRKVFGQWFVELARRYDVQLIYFRIGK